MTWRLAHSLDTLRRQINEMSPYRSKVSDGTIGDARHSSRSSDHNPNPNGVVCALDITHDPAHGVDSGLLASALIMSRDDRIKYIISNGQITSGKNGTKPWVARKYKGKNPHDKHVHISVTGDIDDDRMWFGSFVGSATTTVPQEPENPVLAKGTKGHAVARLQRLLNMRDYDLVVDADFGDKTVKAVKDFQKKSGMTADGIVGPYTWEALTLFG